MSMLGRAHRAGISSRSSETLAIALLVVVASVVAAFSPGEPTGTTGWDGLLKAAFAAVVVIAAAKSPRWPLISMAAIAAGASFASFGALAGWAALALALASSILDRRSRLAGALIAALAIQALLRLPSAGFFGLQSIFVAIAVVPVLILGYRYGTRPARKIARWSFVVLAGGLTLIGVLGGLALLNARTDVNQGVAAARRGLMAARAGDTVGVADELDRAELAFVRANNAVSGIFPKALRLVPVVAQHQRSVETAVEQGSVVTREAAGAVREADIRNLRLTSGSLDLGALSAMAPRLRSAADSLGAAAAAIDDARSPWLLSPIRKRIDELLAEVEDFRPEIELGASAAEVLPDMLGAGGSRTYFVMFGVPAESRELGGFLGSWALLSFDNGRMQLGESGRINELYDIAAASTIAPGSAGDFFLEMARPTQFPQNLPSSPDMAQVAAVSRQVLAGATDVPIDGFIYADGYALIDLLEISGPVTIPFQEAPLSRNNAFQFFFEDQYRVVSADRIEVFDELAAVAQAVLGRITDQTLPGPAELGRVMGPSARGGHLQVVTFDDRANDFLRSVKLLRDFGQTTTADYLALVQTNGLSNKIDLYLHRELSYEGQITSEGEFTATATATLRSLVPPDAPPFTLGNGTNTGLNKVLLSLYSPHRLNGVTVDGLPAEVRSASEFGLGRYLVEVTLPATGVPSIIEFGLAGTLDPAIPYSLELWHQPLVNDDEVSVVVAGPKETVTWTGTLNENMVLKDEP